MAAARRALAPAVALALWLLPAAARAEMADHTHLIGLETGSSFGATVREAARGGFELSGGEALVLRDWYRPEMPQVTLRMMTGLSEGMGLTWGVSTGERGEKYRIAPALHLGFILQEPLGPDAALTLSAGTLVGGNLSERPCTGDYGAFGTMKVNCRLAATTMAPEDTLAHLMKASGRHASWVSLRFDLRF